MKRKIILIGSILAVALLTLVSFSNVVGYQSVKTIQKDTNYRIIGSVSTTNLFRKTSDSDDYERIMRFGFHTNSIITFGEFNEDNNGEWESSSNGFIRAKSSTGDVELWYGDNIWGNLGIISFSRTVFGNEIFTDCFIGIENFTGVIIPRMVFNPRAMYMKYIIIGDCTSISLKEDIATSEYSFDECKDCLFQTIVDISENQEIKDIIKSNYKPQKTLLPFRRSNMDLKVEHLELLYQMGLKIMDRLGEERVEELMESIEFDNELFEQVDSIVMGNDELRDRIYTLNDISKRKLTTDYDDFPNLCLLLGLIFGISYIIIESLREDLIYNKENGNVLIAFLLTLIMLPISLIGVICGIFYLVLCDPWFPYNR